MVGEVGRGQDEGTEEEASNMLTTCLQHACNYGGTLALLWGHRRVALAARWAGLLAQAAT